MPEILLGNIKGERGADFKIIDYYDTPENLAAAITSPSVGDAYGVGTSYPYDIYIYSASNGWVNNGQLQGVQGEKGTSAVITDVTATVDETTGTPSVEVTLGGTESERSFNFEFSGLKGEQGEFPYAYGTTDLTAGSSSLETGKLYFVYE